MLSGIEENQSVVSNGFLAGNELNELVEVYMGDLVGDVVYEKSGNVFPLLIKFLDSKDWLSVQVHPDDNLAAKRRLGNGKTEMWYVIQADENSQLISGFNKKTNRVEYLSHLQQKSLPDILNYENVKEGDVFYIPAGRVHSLGPGILLAEIQQTSDTTYRIYDWDRKDDEGNSRELHTEEALDALDFNFHKDVKTAYEHKLNATSKLLSCPYFTTNLLELAQPLRKYYDELDSFVIYLCLEGNLKLSYGNDKSLTLNKGEVVLIPAIMDEISLFPENYSKILEIYILNVL